MYVITEDPIKINTNACLPLNGAGGAGGSSGVVRSASDTAVLAGAAAWELSLAAASVSKDRRIKDFKTSCLKSHYNKKKLPKTSSDANTQTLGDGAYTFIVQKSINIVLFNNWL